MAETEYAELIERLGKNLRRASPVHSYLVTDELSQEAANAISSLLAENARLKEALTNIAKQKLYDEMVDYVDDERDDLDWVGGFEACVKLARSALNGEPS